MGRYHQYETHFFSDGNVIVIVKFNFVQNYYMWYWSNKKHVIMCYACKRLWCKKTDRHLQFCYCVLQRNHQIPVKNLLPPSVIHLISYISFTCFNLMTTTKNKNKPYGRFTNYPLSLLPKISLLQYCSLIWKFEGVITCAYIEISFITTRELQDHFHTLWHYCCTCS